MYDPLKNARDLMQWGDYHAAMKIYQELVKRDPRDDKMLYHLGTCYLADNRLEEAADCFEACIGINNHNVEALIDLGDVYFKLGTDDRALDVLEQACGLDSSHVRAHTYLARLYEHIGQFPDAIHHYLKAVEESATSEGPRHDLALAYAQNGDYLEAYLILVELLDEADLGLLWSQINITEIEGGLDGAGSREYIRMLKDEVEEVEEMFFHERNYSILSVRYIIEALERFLQLSEDEIDRVLQEVRMLHYIGFDDDDRETEMELHSLKGVYNGVQLGAYLYTAEQLCRRESLLKHKYQMPFSEALLYLQQQGG